MVSIYIILICVLLLYDVHVIITGDACIILTMVLPIPIHDSPGLDQDLTKSKLTSNTPSSTMPVHHPLGHSPVTESSSKWHHST